MEAAERAGGRQRRRRRRIIGVMAALVSLAMILPLAAGIFSIVTGGNSSDSAGPTSTTPTATIPAFVKPGRTITGPIPCPATDGTELRTTTFSGPPPMCIDPAATYSVDVATTKGNVVLTIDPSLDAEAANLFIVLAEYHYFEGLPIYTNAVDGPAISGDAGSLDPGFSIAATPAVPTTSTSASTPATSTGTSGGAAYRIGSVVMAADRNQRISTRFAVVISQDVADALSANPVNPVIGEVSSGLGVLTSIVEDPAAVLGDPATLGSWLDNAIRIDSVSVTRSGTP